MTPAYYHEGATAYTTQREAIAAARRIARKTGETRFVITEAGHLFVASNYDLDTFWSGIRDNQILYCTADH